MGRRKTIHDVARQAGLSVATVDRVLNGRQRVREETARRVYEAAQKIGYHAAGLIGQRLATDLPQMTFGFVLNNEGHAFYQSLAQHIEKAVRECTLVRGRALIEYSPSHDASDFAQTMTNMSGKADVIAATATTHHDITQAVTNLKENGIPTFALLNDFAPGVRHAYVGLNNIKVGRMASWMISTAAKKAGKIGVFIGGHRWHGHELREMGFRSHFREFAPDFHILDTIVNVETRRFTYFATIDLLSRHKDLEGLYLAGGGMEGAIAALKEVRKPGEVALVVNELTNDSSKALSDRYLTMAISTPLEKLCQDLVRLMVEAKLNDQPVIAGQHFLQPELIIPESI